MPGVASFHGLLPGVASFYGLLRLSRNRQWSDQPTVGTPAARLKSPHDTAQPTAQRLADEKDAMQVVGHHLKVKNLDLRMVVRNVPPLVPNGATQFSQLYAGIVAAAIDTAE